MKTTRQQRGQGMTEYIVIVALVAIAAIATYQFFGKTVRDQTAAIAKEISGSDGTAAKTASQTSSAAAATEADIKHSLDSYTGNEAKN